VKRSPIKRKTKLVAKSKPKARSRAPKDFARVYGSKARVAWVAAQPCAACGKGPCENAHTKSGGVGRKADYRHIIPLCAACHRVQHSKGWKALGFNAAKLEYVAYRTQFQWALTGED